MRAVFVLLTLLLSSDNVWGQSAKMDLDDITIKGELHNDDRLKLLARQKNELKNYVKYRTNYRSEITEDLPRPKPQVKY